MKIKISSLFLLSILFFNMIIFIPTVQAYTEPILVNGYSEENTPFYPPIIFNETSEYIKIDNGLTFTIEFYKGTSGYNKIYDLNGDVLVYDERIILEYLHNKNWKQKGVPINLSWIKIADNYYEVTRHYDDYLGTTFDVIYSIRTGEGIKTTVILNSGQTDNYRIVWISNGITQEFYTFKPYSIIFGDENSDNWIGFNWNDVYLTFGDITTTFIETTANGKKANIYFNIGIIEDGESLTLDPVLLDSYAVGNFSDTQLLKEFHPAVVLSSAFGQTFKSPVTAKITSVKFYMAKVALPTGSGHAVLYAHNGVFGVNGQPIGAPLATSLDFDVSTIGVGMALHELHFIGLNQYELQANTPYCIIFENPLAGNINVVHYISMGGDLTAPSHAGNLAMYYTGGWHNHATHDAIFYVYGQLSAPPPSEQLLTSGQSYVTPMKSKSPLFVILAFVIFFGLIAVAYYKNRN